MDPRNCTLFLLASFTLSGVAQVIWLKSKCLRQWAIPLDGRRTFRGHRLLGENKTWRGFMVMVPVAGLAFWGLARCIQASHGSLTQAGLWNLSPLSYALLGAWSGFGFMAGELPNSFLKRQLGIEPGEMARGPISRWALFALDRCDSILGLLVALSIFVPTTWEIWIGMLFIGAGIHWLFNVVLYLLRVKSRPA